MKRLGGLLRLLLAAAVLVVVAWVGWHAWRTWRPRPAARAAAGPLVVTAIAHQQDLLITVDQTGALTAKDSTPVPPEVNGRLVWLCDNGIVVTKDQPLALLDPRERIDEAQQSLEQHNNARRSLQQASQKAAATLAKGKITSEQARQEAAAFERKQQASLRDMKNDVTFREGELARHREQLEVKRRLLAKGLVAGTEVEREEAALKAEQFNLEKARTDLELKQSEAQAQILDKQKEAQDAERNLQVSQRQAETEVRMAQNALDSQKLTLARIQEELSKCTVKAPAPGVVVLGERELGDEVWPGRGIAEIVNLQNLQVKLELDQRDITNVKVGQQVMVQVDALPDKVYLGKVAEIGKTARRPPIEGAGWWQSAGTTFPVTVELPKLGRSRLRPGMRANARIVTKREKNAIVVPAECIFRQPKRFVVYVEQEDGYRPVPVKVGDSNGDYTALTSGLQAGQRVALNEPPVAAGPAGKGKQAK